MKWSKVLVLPALLVIGCGAEPMEQASNESTESISEVEPEVASVTSELLTTNPSNFTGWVTVEDQAFGTWRQAVFCNEGWYAVGFDQRVEGRASDTTGLNSVRLICKQKVGPAFETISSYDGLWGNWSAQSYCPGGTNYSSSNFINGAHSWNDPYRGSNYDDTMMNGVEVSCTNGGTAAADNNGYRGRAWGSWAQCPQGQAVCGLNIKFESYTGGGDDTAQNGLKFACCTL